MPLSGMSSWWIALSREIVASVEVTRRGNWKIEIRNSKFEIRHDFDFRVPNFVPHGLVIDHFPSGGFLWSIFPPS